MILEDTVASVDRATRAMTMAHLIVAFCDNPSDADLRSRLALGLMMTGPLIYQGRAWAYSVDEGVWIGPDLAAHRRHLAEEPGHFDGELAAQFGYRRAAAVAIPG